MEQSTMMVANASLSRDDHPGYAEKHNRTPIEVYFTCLLTLVRQLGKPNKEVAWIFEACPSYATSIAMASIPCFKESCMLVFTNPTIFGLG
jgi:hypothetical protein